MKAYPEKRKVKLVTAIPASLTADTPHLREKTAKVGLVGRSLAIFRVEEVIIYPDEINTDQREEMALIASLLKYMEMPPYLRKALIRLSPRLRYAGILPPLRTPHHPLEDQRVLPGDLREGMVVKSGRDASMVYVGLKEMATVRARLPEKKRVTVRIVSTEPTLEAMLVDRDEVSVYWGYKISVSDKPLGKLAASGDFAYRIATSRYGLDGRAVLGELAKKLAGGRVLIAFGSPRRGLKEILEDEALKLPDVFDITINTLPNQGVETVRTEEALISTLAILNIIV